MKLANHSRMRRMFTRRREFVVRSCLFTFVVLLQSALICADSYGEDVPPTPRGSSGILQTYTDITAAEARAMLDSGMDLLFLDVRTEGEYEAGHITEPTDALNMPLGTYLAEHHEELPEKPIIVYCASGGRSRSAAQFLVDNGHSDIYNMLGGYSAWLQLPTRTPTPAATPTPRASQLWLLDALGRVHRLPAPTPTPMQTPAFRR